MKILMDKHTSILGETQTGKTLLANHLFSITGGLFIDIEDVGDIKAQATLTRRNSPAQFVRTLRKYKYVKYVPSEREAKSLLEVKWVWRALKKLNKNIFVYVDEIQNWGGSRKNAFDVYAIRGLKYGIHLVAISQRPQNISKTILTQSPTVVIFDISGMEKKYFEDKGLPYEDIKNNLMNEPKYSFVVYRRGKGVSDAQKLNI